LRGENPQFFYFPGAATLQTKPKRKSKKFLKNFMMIFTLWTWKKCGCFKKIEKGMERRRNGKGRRIYR